nr:MAG TPA: hypothetical protein [Caudoviricetes sp.]
MKPRRYPYTGRLKKPARLMLKEWQRYYDNYLQSLEYRDSAVKIDCKRSNDVEFKSDGVVFNKSTIKTGPNIKPEEIPGYQEPVLKFDHKRLDAIEFKIDGLTINRI